jgi:hypothetical protein
LVSPSIGNAMRQSSSEPEASDVESICSAASGERTRGRTNSRKGYREREWDTLGRHDRAHRSQAASGLLLPGLTAQAPTSCRACPGGGRGGVLPAGVRSTTPTMEFTTTFFASATSDHSLVPRIGARPSTHPPLPPPREGRLARSFALTAAGTAAVWRLRL